MRVVKKDYGMDLIYCWDRNTLEWDGCCSHCCLYEAISSGFESSAEELEVIAAQRRQKHLDAMSFNKKSALTKHFKTPKHLRKAHDLATSPHQYHFRNVAFERVGHLSTHLKIKRHQEGRFVELQARLRALSLILEPPLDRPWNYQFLYFSSLITITNSF